MHFECAYFSFFLFHLALKWKNTFLLSRGSLDNHIRFQSCVQWRIQGEGPRGPDSTPPPPPPPLDLTLNCLRMQFLHRQDRISLFNWLVFLTETRVVFCH